MAKKSTAGRNASNASNASAARRPQPTTKNPARQVTLVRTPEMVAAGASGTTPTAGTVTPSGSPNGSARATAVREPVTQPTANSAAASVPGATRNTTPAKAATPAPKPAARPMAATTPAARSAQASRSARAQAMQRARAVHLISAENYSYVVNDLKLTGILAASMFFVILVLHFIIG